MEQSTMPDRDDVIRALLYRGRKKITLGAWKRLQGTPQGGHRPVQGARRVAQPVVPHGGPTRFKPLSKISKALPRDAMRPASPSSGSVASL
jgi:hypothetical protein